MGTAIAKTEPLILPDVRRPEMLPPWPVWVASRIASARVVTQSDKAGKHRKVNTLPKNLLLGSSERRELERYAGEIARICDAAPQASAELEAAMLVVLTQMLLALPAATKGETGAEARGEAYMAALDDVPVWAVQAALRRWYRGECVPTQFDSRGRSEPHNYQWAPAPATLRKLAAVEFWRIKARETQVRNLLEAEELIEFSEEHCAGMREKIGELPKLWAAPPDDDRKRANEGEAA